MRRQAFLEIYFLKCLELVLMIAQCLSDFTFPNSALWPLSHMTGSWPTTPPTLGSIWSWTPLPGSPAQVQSPVLGPSWTPRLGSSQPGPGVSTPSHTQDQLCWNREGAWRWTTKLYKAVQRSTKQYKSVQCITKQYKVVQSTTQQDKAVQSRTKQNKSVQCYTNQYKTIQRSTTQCKAVQSYTKH